MEVFGCGFNGFGQLLPEVSKRCLLSPVKIFPDCRKLPRKSASHASEHVEEPRSSRCASDNFRTLASSWSAVYIINDSNIWLQGFSIGQKSAFQILKTSNEMQLPPVMDMDSAGEKLYYTTIEGECIEVDIGTGQEMKVRGNETTAKTNFLKVASGDLSKVAITGEFSAGLISSENGNRVFRPFDIAVKFSQVCCGQEHVILLSEIHQVYSFGLGSRGQLGHGTTDGESQPRLLEALGCVPVESIGAGGWHSAAVSTIGDLYIWGWNESGQLGFSMQRKSQCTSGGVYQDAITGTCESHPGQEKMHPGMKRAFQQDTGQERTTKKKVPSLSSSETCQESTQSPEQENNFPTEDTEREQRLRASQLHQAAGTSLEDAQHQEQPSNLHSVQQRSIQRGEAGKTETLTREAAGHKYSTVGSSCLGSEHCGRRDDVVLFQPLPRILDLPDRKEVSKVSCGSRHTAAISDGCLYTWGWGQYGQLGLGNTQTRDTPTKVKCFREDRQVVDVSCGGWNTLIVIASRQ
ncbi:ultraviolet-B receptor UVR8-like isoform X2 [Acanthaster planci]|uniref:Ultraviolet-B receptor UVR8-like isoform X2 n=1 Tax=Acanthaster planci TaxID=133434 RepID=A0A8B7Y0I7_ACAPL|nr:ultraviolet-B receptor UVR8-like isoform X2 [Acanthaster planci]